MNARLVPGVLAVASAIAFFTTGSRAVVAQDSENAASGLRVIELFTSEGCSSCPPADRLLTELSQRSDVLALSFHVDYWDRLGWRDPFSSKAVTQRQYAYAASFQSDRVYTPQAVIGGNTEAVGSRASDVIARLSSIVPANTDLKIAVKTTRGTRRVSLETAADVAKVTIALVQPMATSEVGRGENGGRTLSHTNVVRDFVSTVPVEGRAIGEVSVDTELPGLFLAVYTHANDGTILSARVIP